MCAVYFCCQIRHCRSPAVTLASIVKQSLVLHLSCKAAHHHKQGFISFQERVPQEGWGDQLVPFFIVLACMHTMPSCCPPMQPAARGSKSPLNCFVRHTGRASALAAMVFL